MFKKIAFALVTVLSLQAVSLTPASAQAPSESETAQTVIVSQGTFKGRNRHVTTGTVTIVKTDAGYQAILESDFSLDGAPAPTLGFGNRKFDKSTEFSALKSNTGRQVYDLPASINPADFSKFYVWCADFSVALGVAELKPAA